MDNSMHIRHHMNPVSLILKGDQQIAEAISLFNKHNLFGAPVVDDIGNLIGILSGTDCIRCSMESNFDQNWRGLVKDYMTKNVSSVEANYSCLFVAKMFLDEPYRRYPVLEDNRVIGQIERHDILRALASKS